MGRLTLYPRLVHPVDQQAVPASPAPGVDDAPTPSPDLCWVPGQTFRMGSVGFYAEEAPQHLAMVAGFWMQRHQTTNAERSGRDLPSEAEWEAAARGGLDGATYTWSDAPERRDERLANYWHGDFPWRPAPGYGSTAPVESFPANGYGLHDMAGNVWEWTTDWYADRHLDDAADRCCAPQNPRGAGVDASYDHNQPQFRIPRKVIKGGSFLCADRYCLRYRPGARRPQMIDTGMSHIGFRCIVRPGTPAGPS